MKTYVIIGNSAAGIATAESIRESNKEDKIMIISDENYPAYYRYLIPSYLRGDIKEEKLLYRNLDFFKQNNIDLLLNTEAIEIRTKKNTVILQKKDESSFKKIHLEYDCLVLTNGASPEFPEIKGIHKKGVFGFRNINDAKQISEFLPISDTACVLGEGIVGLKVAYALRKRGLEVKVVIGSNQLLSQVFDKESGEIFQQAIKKNGIEVVVESDIATIIGNGYVKAVKLANGKVFGSSIVVIDKGVRPNVDLVKGTEIEIEDGIIVDDYMRTNIPNIFAAGDVCALHSSVSDRCWPKAVEQGKIAGKNITGADLKYNGSVCVNSFEFFNLPVVSIGVINKKDESYQELCQKQNNVYKKLVFKDNLLVGTILMGDLKNNEPYLNLIKNRIDISFLKERLLEDNFSSSENFIS